MQFDYVNPTDLTKPDQNPLALAEYSKLANKLPNAIKTEKKARPWWTLASGIASSFIPFGLGAFITPTASFLVDKRKEQQTDKLNLFRRRLGLAEKADTSGSGMNLGGLGFAAGSSISTSLGRDIIPSEGTGVKTLNFSGVGGAVPNFNQPNITQTPNDESYSRNVDYTTDGNPTAPAQTGGGVTGLEGLPNSPYFGAGGSATGIIPADNGLTYTPPTSMRHGGKIEAPSHEEGGIELVMNGKNIGIEVEGKERIVNNNDWKKIISFLDKGKNKNALALLKDIDKRKPVEQKAELGTGEINLGQTPTGYYDFNGGTTAYDPSALNTQFAPTEEISTTTTIQPTNLPVDNTLNTNQPKMDWNEALRYGFDVGKLSLGLSEAMKKLPQWQQPRQWNDFMGKAKYFSEQGLLPEEKAEAINLADNAYATQVRDITNASGGNAGVLLGNLTAANQNRMKIANQLALADRQEKERSFDKYENRLMKDVAMKKDIFDTQLNQAMLNKKEGAALASDALANITGRMDFNKYYGEGSYYDKLQKALVEKGVSEAEIKKLQADFYKNPANFIAAYTSESADPKVKAAIQDVDALEASKKGKEITTKTASSVADLFTPKKTK